MKNAKCLKIVGTPIGNLEDITIRGLRGLLLAKVIVCEDTRRTGSLLAKLEERVGEWEMNVERSSEQKYISYRDQNHERAFPKIIEAIEEYGQVVFVSDSGMPTISDPGYKLIRDLLTLEVQIDVIPGPVAFVAGVAMSGLPTDRISFLGFLPKKGGQSKKLLGLYGNTESTLAIYESPYRVMKTLVNVEEVLGNREVCVVLELTKMHQRAFRGEVRDVITQLEKTNIKGEAMIFVAKEVL